MTLLKSFLFILIVPGTVAVLIPWALVGYFGPGVLQFGPLSLLAIPLWALGAAGLFWSALDFAQKGEGTPAPIDAPKKLVVSGLYRYVRNPMYVSVLTILLGQFLWFSSRWVFAYSLFMFTAFHLFITNYEEPNLKRLFGAQFERYARAVPRWLPRLKPYRSGEH
jgi:protein-S-isoprenylcysteine O-methyltransferase Ste14